MSESCEHAVGLDQPCPDCPFIVDKPLGEYPPCECGHRPGWHLDEATTRSLGEPLTRCRWPGDREKPAPLSVSDAAKAGESLDDCPCSKYVPAVRGRRETP